MPKFGRQRIWIASENNAEHAEELVLHNQGYDQPDTCVAVLGIKNQGFDLHIAKEGYPFGFYLHVIRGGGDQNGEEDVFDIQPDPLFNYLRRRPHLFHHPNVGTVLPHWNFSGTDWKFGSMENLFVFIVPKAENGAIDGRGRNIIFKLQAVLLEEYLALSLHPNGPELIELTMTETPDPIVSATGKPTDRITIGSAPWQQRAHVQLIQTGDISTAGHGRSAKSEEEDMAGTQVQSTSDPHPSAEATVSAPSQPRPTSNVSASTPSSSSLYDPLSFARQAPEGRRFQRSPSAVARSRRNRLSKLDSSRDKRKRSIDGWDDDSDWIDAEDGQQLTAGQSHRQGEGTDQKGRSPASSKPASDDESIDDEDIPISALVVTKRRALEIRRPKPSIDSDSDNEEDHDNADWEDSVDSTRFTAGGKNTQPTLTRRRSRRLLMQKMSELEFLEVPTSDDPFLHAPKWILEMNERPFAIPPVPIDRRERPVKEDPMSLWDEREAERDREREEAVRGAQERGLICRTAKDLPTFIRLFAGITDEDLDGRELKLFPPSRVSISGGISEKSKQSEASSISSNALTGPIPGRSLATSVEAFGMRKPRRKALRRKWDLRDYSEFRFPSNPELDAAWKRAEARRIYIETNSRKRR